MKKIVIILILFVSCSPKLIINKNIDDILIEKISINYLKNISSYKLQPNENLQIRQTENNDNYCLSKETEDDLTVISFTKTNKKISDIKKEKYIYKNNSQTISYFYSDGNLKTRNRSTDLESISNIYFTKINFSSFLKEFISFDNNGKIENHLDFDKDYEYKLSNFISDLTKITELKGKQINIGTAYLSGEKVFGDMGLASTEELKKNYPYWSLTYNIDNSSNYNLWIYDGKTGKFIEKKLIVIKSAH